MPPRQSLARSRATDAHNVGWCSVCIDSELMTSVPRRQVTECERGLRLTISTSSCAHATVRVIPPIPRTRVHNRYAHAADHALIGFGCCVFPRLQKALRAESLEHDNDQALLRHLRFSARVRVCGALACDIGQRSVVRACVGTVHAGEDAQRPI